MRRILRGIWELTTGPLILFFTGVGMSLYVGIYLRFKHPHYTETELFLAFWVEGAIAVIFLVIGGTLVLLDKGGR